MQVECVNCNSQKYCKRRICQCCEYWTKKFAKIGLGYGEIEICAKTKEQLAHPQTACINFKQKEVNNV